MNQLEHVHIVKQSYIKKWFLQVVWTFWYLSSGYCTSIDLQFNLILYDGKKHVHVVGVWKLFVSGKEKLIHNYILH